MRCGAYREPGHQRKHYITDGNYPAAWRHEGGVVGVKQKKKKGNKAVSYMSVLPEHQLHFLHLFLTITALRASTDEKTVEQKKKKDT